MVISQRLLTTLRELGAESAGCETGGILAGYYNDGHDTAIITRREGPPSDSKMKSDCFYRGTRGRRNLLKRLWEVQEYSLGEGHIIPAAKRKPAPKTGTRGRPLRTMPQSLAPNPS